MGTVSTEESEAFCALLENQYSRACEKTSILKSPKAKAWELFQQRGLPCHREELYRHLRLRQLFSQTYSTPSLKSLSKAQIASYIFPESTHSVLIFINGLYAPELSDFSSLPDRVVIQPLHEAFTTYGTLLNNHWNRMLKEEKDCFTMINAALHQSGLFLYFPPKTVIEKPIQILNIISADQETPFATPRTHLFAGAHSQLSLISSVINISGSQYCLNQTMEFSLDDNAHVHLIQNSHTEPKTAWHFDSVRAHLKRNSVFKSINITEGSATVRYDYKIALAGENAETSLSGLWMLSDRREAHTNVLIEHLEPHCRSMQLFKGILNDCSRSSFEGKIYVHEKAQKTEAFQLNNNLLLHDGSQANSKPNLEIFADDVKASHGATVGQLDQEQVFYLKSRGFSEAEAKSLLVYSYCKEILESIKNPLLLETLDLRIKQALLVEKVLK